MRLAILSKKPGLYTTSRLVEAARARGHQCEVINYTKCNCAIAKGQQRIYAGDQPIAGLHAVIPRIDAMTVTYGAAIVRQLETMGVFTATTSISITRSKDKLRSHQILAKHGIDTPKTAFACSPEDVDNIINILGGPPLVIKTVEGAQGNGVVLAETRSACRSTIQAFYGLKANIIVQEFIREANGSDIRAFVVGEEVVGAIRRQGAEGEFRSNLHQGGTAEKIELSEKEKKLAVRAAQALGLQIAGVDMLPTEKGSKVIEVNSSPGIEGLEKATNIDVADRIIEFVEDNARKKRRKKDKVGA